MLLKQNFMLRLACTILLIWLCGEVAGQGVHIPRSSDIVVIRGKSYYLHTVQPGQTLYSISKAYGVETEELKKLNDKKDNNLSLYEVLKVPFVEQFVQQDDKYYYHRVAKGETLYSIARKYGIKIRRLLKYNENYAHNEPVAVGAVIRLPLKEIDLTGIKNTADSIQSSHIEKTDVITQGNVSMRMEDIVREEKQEKVSPVEKQTAADTLKEGEIIPPYISEVVLPADPFVKVVLLLPFSARQYPLLTDSLPTGQTVKISPRIEQFLYFYEGMLLAIDSLKQQGSQIKLYVYDTERSPEKMFLLADEINRIKPDLIIGPVYGSVYKILAEQLQNKNIPVIYPLSSRSENFGEHPNFIQVNATYETMVKAMTGWVREQQKNANVLQINLFDEEYGYAETPEKKLFTDQMMGINGVRFFDWNMAQVPLDTLRQLLLPDRENILLFPTTREAEVSKVLPMLSALADGYPITVVGLPEWQMFTSVDHETYYKLNTKIFTYSYVDNSSVAARQLTEKFRKYFYAEPHSLVFKAFDMGLYFIHLADKYRDRLLDAIDYQPKDGAFSRFSFGRMEGGAGKENKGFFIVNYGSDYLLKVESADVK